MNTLGNRRLIIILIFLSAMLASCTIKYGSIPATEKISSSLIQHTSTKDDVLKVLGPPRGYGKYQMSIMPEAHVIWYYEYMQASNINYIDKSMDLDLKMLMVFFDKEIYAGHMWFSSFEKFEEVKRIKHD
jgi:hypothetical protein